MSKGSREKCKRVEFKLADDAVEQDEFADEMCDECGFFIKTANSDVCEVCEAMATPNPGSFK
jgi:rubrerythrin